MQETARRVVTFASEPQNTRLARAVLTHRGYDLVVADNPAAAAQQVSQPGSVLAVDVGRREGNEREASLELVRSVRASDPILPIICIGPRIDSACVVEALDDGADDYVLTPTNAGAILGVVIEAFQRLEFERMAEPQTYHDRSVQVGLATRQVMMPGRSPAQFTETECRLLGELMANAGRVLTHRHLLREVWGHFDDAAIANLHVYVNQIRKKLEPDPRTPVYLQTHRGIGYRFAPASGGLLRG